MTTTQDSKTNCELTLLNRQMSALRQEMINVQKDQLVDCIREFFDEGDACEPVCYLNVLMKSNANHEEGLRISTFLMQMERFDRCIKLLQKR